MLLCQNSIETVFLADGLFFTENKLSVKKIFTERISGDAGSGDLLKPLPQS